MTSNRRTFFIRGAVGAAALSLTQASNKSTAASNNAASNNDEVSGKHLGTIFNNDFDNILAASSGKQCTPDEYQRAVFAILDLQPGVLAQNVGSPDALIYPSAVTNTLDKYHAAAAQYMSNPEYERPRFQNSAWAMQELFHAGTDPLQLTIDACRQRNVLCLASYRMNAEDYYSGQTSLSDFERQHPEWKIPGRNCLDWAIPQVYQHRMNIFRDVVDRYDIDGLEFDFRRHHHMVSNPEKNHVVLSQLVQETRQMLDEAAQKKGRKRLLLEARVCPSLNTDPHPFVYPGCMYGPRKPYDRSCQDLGLDLKLWLSQGWVDAICPSLFLAGLPRIREFVDLAAGTKTGVYPTLFPGIPFDSSIFDLDTKLPRPKSLQEKEPMLVALYKDELCGQALKIYDDGADGISTFNWAAHLRTANMPNRVLDTDGADGLVLGATKDKILSYVYPLLRDPAAIRNYREQPWVVPPTS
ncbi:MAG: family 10 glycosylhydrolase [Planctomycetota bacterium]|nr:family 10 glycosylhydrolase [Planctomycetota bacterium]